MCDDVCERLASDWPTHTYIHIQLQAKITGRPCIPKIWEVDLIGVSSYFFTTSF